jgi:hypothetical protein
LREFVGKSILHDFSLWGDRGSVENQLWKDKPNPKYNPDRKQKNKRPQTS